MWLVPSFQLLPPFLIWDFKGGHVSLLISWFCKDLKNCDENKRLHAVLSVPLILVNAAALHTRRTGRDCKKIQLVLLGEFSFFLTIRIL